MKRRANTYVDDYDTDSAMQCPMGGECDPTGPTDPWSRGIVVANQSVHNGIEADGQALDVTLHQCACYDGGFDALTGNCATPWEPIDSVNTADALELWALDHETVDAIHGRRVSGIDLDGIGGNDDAYIWRDGGCP